MPTSEGAPQKKGLLIILDGLGDRPASCLGGLTPLEAARTPNMDHLLSKGMGGMTSAIQPGIAVGTQIGTSLLMGLAPAEALSLQRGPVEAAGAGFEMNPEDLFIRCNFATLKQQGDGYRIVDRRAGRIRKGREKLVASLNSIYLDGNVRATIRCSTQHRAVIRFSGAKFSTKITDTDPGAGFSKKGLNWCRPVFPEDENATFTANQVNRYLRKCFRILKDHPINVARERAGKMPANGLLTRGAGMPQTLHVRLNQLKLKVAIVAAESTVTGLGTLFGFDILKDDRFTALPGTDLHLKVSKVFKALQDHDLVFLHIKGTDTSAHDRNPVAKKDFIEQIDSAFLPFRDVDFAIGITGDHSTDSNVGRHTGDPVPSILRVPGMRRDNLNTFDERTCIDGGLGYLSAASFLHTLLDQMNRLNNFRPEDRIFL